MSILSARAGNYFFDQLPDDAVIPICAYLRGENGTIAFRADDKGIIRTALICKSWRDNQILNSARKESILKLTHGIHEQRNYPDEMIQLFRKCTLPLASLPELYATKIIGIIDSEHMTYPVMRFRDQFGQPGIALHIEGYIDSMSISRLSGVMSIYCSSLRDNRWEIEISGKLNDTMYFLHDKLHLRIGNHRPPNCPNCPTGMRTGDAVSYKTLSDLLTGQDLLFRIAQGWGAK